MKELILATDLVEHARTTENFKKMLEEGIDYDNQAHKIAVSEQQRQKAKTVIE